MKKKIILLCLFFISINLQAQQHNHKNCLTNVVRAMHLAEYPERLQKRVEIERFTQEWIAANKYARNNTVITIPVVVHVVWKENVENITAAQIQSQIDVLNKDFRKNNSDTINTPTVFQSLAADAEIEFCLASVDPNGNITNGITRHQTNTNEIGNQVSLFTTAQIWNPDNYLNIWVCEIEESGGLLGFATPPGTSGANDDGAVIDYRFFGTIGTAQAPIDLGRTATHEIGHYFNLEHIWGVNGGCNDDDLVADTPNQNTDYGGCPTHPQTSCNSTDMFMNFMDYVDDACMSMFTQGQKMRMLAAINGPRASLLNSNGCSGSVATEKINSLEGKIKVLPTLTTGQVEIQLNLTTFENIEIKVYNTVGQLYQSLNVENNTQFNIDLSNFTNGLYFINIRIGNNYITKKITLIK